MAKNFYDVLGVPKNATGEQIRSHFLELTRQRHPDRFHGAEKARAETEFQNITEAFNVLSNAERRRQHDLDLARPQQRQAADPDQLLKVYLNRGIRAYKEKNYLQAAESFDRATKAQPDSARAWHYLALACSHQRRWLSRATHAITRAAELEPMNANYLKLAGRLFESAGRLSKAEQYYAEALKWAGGDEELDQRLAEVRKAARKSRGGFFGKG